MPGMARRLLFGVDLTGMVRSKKQLFRQFLPGVEKNHRRQETLKGVGRFQVVMFWSASPTEACDRQEGGNK
jgi:hypothetical protein